MRVFGQAARACFTRSACKNGWVQLAHVAVDIIPEDSYHQEPSSSSAIGIAGRVGRVRDSLKAHTTSTEIGKEFLEHGWSGDGADVAAFGGASSEDDGERCAAVAVADVVRRGAAPVLTRAACAGSASRGWGRRSGCTTSGCWRWSCTSSSGGGASACIFEAEEGAGGTLLQLICWHSQDHIGQRQGCEAACDFMLVFWVVS